jgi:pilus assembly protein Flp/PilA
MAISAPPQRHACYEGDENDHTGARLRWQLRMGFTIRSRHGQNGQGMVEYALILVLVSIVVIVILLTMGRQVSNVFSNIASALGRGGCTVGVNCTG